MWLHQWDWYIETGPGKPVIAGCHPELLANLGHLPQDTCKHTWKILETATKFVHLADIWQTSSSWQISISFFRIVLCSISYWKSIQYTWYYWDIRKYRSQLCASPTEPQLLWLFYTQSATLWSSSLSCCFWSLPMTSAVARCVWAWAFWRLESGNHRGIPRVLTLSIKTNGL